MFKPVGTNRSERRKRGFPLFGILVFGLLFLGLFGVALARANDISANPQKSQTTTTSAQNTEICQALIENAIKASKKQCDHMGQNEVCYGHVTLQAELQPNFSERFSEQGDVIPVEQLQRLSASPLDINTNEWGVAIFRVMANMPGALPGQTVTMVVFGNFVLDNRSNNLEAFYFSSQLGRLMCDKAPRDGMLITMPDGAGVQFNINGAEFSLQGDASLTAIRNDSMEIALYEGNATITSAGKEQIFNAGEMVTLPLGGEGGTKVIGVPSIPRPLSPTEWTFRTLLSTESNNRQNGSPSDVMNPKQTEESEEEVENATEQPEEQDKEVKDKDKDKDKDKNKDKQKDKEKEKEKDKVKEKDKEKKK